MNFSIAATLLISNIFIAIDCDAFQPASTFASRSTSAFVKDVTNNQISTTSLNEGNPFQSIMDSVFQPKENAKSAAPKLPDAVIEPNYNLAIGSGLLGALIVALTPGIVAGTLGTFVILLTVLFTVQTKRIRFVFDEVAFELKSSSDYTEDLKDTGENFVVGGSNRWNYDSFVNYDFFPSAKFPILVYFKETQTPSNKWDEGPGQLDKVGGGQVHFFPALCNIKQIEEQFQLRGCAKIPKQ